MNSKDISDGEKSAKKNGDEDESSKETSENDEFQNDDPEERIMELMAEKEEEILQYFTCEYSPRKQKKSIQRTFPGKLYVTRRNVYFNSQNFTFCIPIENILKINKKMFKSDVLEFKVQETPLGEVVKKEKNQYVLYRFIHLEGQKQRDECVGLIRGLMKGVKNMNSEVNLNESIVEESPPEPPVEEMKVEAESELVNGTENSILGNIEKTGEEEMKIPKKVPLSQPPVPMPEKPRGGGVKRSSSSGHIANNVNGGSVKRPVRKLPMRKRSAKRGHRRTPSFPVSLATRTPQNGVGTKLVSKESAERLKRKKRVGGLEKDTTLKPEKSSEALGSYFDEDMNAVLSGEDESGRTKEFFAKSCYESFVKIPEHDYFFKESNSKFSAKEVQRWTMRMTLPSFLENIVNNNQFYLKYHASRGDKDIELPNWCKVNESYFRTVKFLMRVRMSFTSRNFVKVVHRNRMTILTDQSAVMWEQSFQTSGFVGSDSMLLQSNLMAFQEGPEKVKIVIRIGTIFVKPLNFILRWKFAQIGNSILEDCFGTVKAKIVEMNNEVVRSKNSAKPKKPPLPPRPKSFTEGQDTQHLSVDDLDIPLEAEDLDIPPNSQQMDLEIEQESMSMHVNQGEVSGEDKPQKVGIWWVDILLRIYFFLSKKGRWFWFGLFVFVLFTIVVRRQAAIMNQLDKYREFTIENERAMGGVLEDVKMHTKKYVNFIENQKLDEESRWISVRKELLRMERESDEKLKIMEKMLMDNSVNNLKVVESLKFVVEDLHALREAQNTLLAKLEQKLTDDEAEHIRVEIEPRAGSNIKA